MPKASAAISHDLDMVDLTIGISAGVACYKALMLCRHLQDQGWSCRFVMTPAATQLLSPTLCQSISGRPVYVDDRDFSGIAHGMGHISLAQATRRLLIYPATQHTLARLSLGLADHLLLQMCLARAPTVPLFVAPAMNTHMWHHPSTHEHITRLKTQGVYLIGPDEGYQACGHYGTGRLVDPAETHAFLVSPPSLAPLSFRSALVTAGPTRSMLDPVRCIQNLSSGKMGFALAATLARHGIQVSLVHGPCPLPLPYGVQAHAVTTTHDMYDVVHALTPQHEVFIANAAPCDYYLPQVPSHKISKQTHTELHLCLSPTPDILAAVSAGHPRPYCVGFCVSSSLETSLREKYHNKQLDLIFGCSADNNIGEDDIALTLYDGQQCFPWPRLPKTTAADEVVKAIDKGYAQLKAV